MRDMDDDDGSPSGINGMHPEIRIVFKQHGKTILGDVSIREFQNSGEVSMGGLIAEQVKFWNELEQNKKDGVTAHIVLMLV